MVDQINIFIADDDQEDQMIMMNSLQDFFRPESIHFSEDGIMLLESLNASIPDNRPKLIILDLNMPRLNGIETLRRLKESDDLKDIPVVILSTSVTEKQKNECIMLGAIHYLVKPSTYNEAKQIGVFIHELVNAQLSNIE